MRHSHNVKPTILYYLLGFLLILSVGVTQGYAQSRDKKKTEKSAPEPTQQQKLAAKKFVVSGGVMQEKGAQRGDSIARPSYSATDSLRAEQMGIGVEQYDSLRRTKFDAVAMLPDSIAADSLGISILVYDSLRTVNRELIAVDSLRVPRQKSTISPDSLIKSSTSMMLYGEEPERELTKREKRRLEREEQDADSTFVRYSKLFRDTLPLPRMSAISMVLPGFSQVHNKQAWKLPILYGVAGFSAVMWSRENRRYKPLKKEFDFLTGRGADRVTELDPVQRRMIKSNTRRQLWMAATVGTYIYFIGDGAINYPGMTSSVKKATTLSTIFPGAGQIYNGSYWKVPFVLGGFAAMVYIIDWNNRGYKRMDTALRLQRDPNSFNEFEVAAGNVKGAGPSAQHLTNFKSSYRRNRDLAIILTGALYLLNIVDAHVDAHLKDYDISDDLTMKMDIVPSVTTLITQTKGSANILGLSLQMKF